MQTQRDHVDAYQTLIGRMSAALVLGDTNYGEPPARRAFTGLVYGVVLALLIGVGCWVYGLINPGGNMAWKAAGAILVEKESGARYVFQDGRLVPVRNHASAMLLQGPGNRVESISRASLTDLPRGAPIGITDAPDSVPAAADLVTAPWLVCLPGSGQLSLNLDPDAESRPLAADEYLWVAAQGGRQYLLWQNQRLPLADPGVAVALGLGTGLPSTAPDAWLTALPEGPEIGAAPIPGDGTPGPEIGGEVRPVGTVFRLVVANGAEQFSALLADGLAPMSRTEAVLAQARTGRSPVTVSAAAVAAAPRSADHSLTQRIPDLLAARSVPEGERAFCLRQTNVRTEVVSEVVTVSRPVARLGTDLQTGAYVKPGTGLLVASVPAPVGQNAKPDRFLITDRGVKYALADDEAIQSLGLGGVAPRPMARAVLAYIPNGPGLSRAAVGVVEKG